MSLWRWHVERYRAALREIGELVEGYADVVDDENGPKPNLAMRVQEVVKRELGARPKETMSEKRLACGQLAEATIFKPGDPGHCVECALARVSALQTERDALKAALAFKRNVVIHDDPRFIGEWVAVPKEDFDKARAALSAAEGRGE